MATYQPEHADIGAIIWLRKADLAATIAPHIPQRAFNHPCVVVDIEPGRERFTICIITSFGSTSIANRREEAERRGSHVPILPSAYYEDTPPVSVELIGRVELRRDSWINVNNSYTVPVEALSTFDGHAVDYFLLTAFSVDKLRRWCGLQSLERGTQVPRQLAREAPLRPDLLEDVAGAMGLASSSPSFPPPPSYSFEATQETTITPQMLQAFDRLSAPPAERSQARMYEETTPLLARHTTHAFETGYPWEVTSAVPHAVHARVEARGNGPRSRPHARNTHRQLDEEAGTPGGRPRSSNIKKIIMALWLHLPSRQTVFQSLMWAIGICIVGGTLGGLGYGAYLVVHKIIMVVMTGWHAIVRATAAVVAGFAGAWRTVVDLWKTIVGFLGGVEAGFAGAWRAIAHFWSKVVGFFGGGGKAFGSAGYGMIRIVQHLVGVSKNLLNRG